MVARAGGEVLDPAHLVNLLGSGRRYVSLRNGGRAEIPREALGRLQETLTLLGARALASRPGAEPLRFAARLTDLGLVPESLGEASRLRVETDSLAELARGLRAGGTGLDALRDGRTATSAGRAEASASGRIDPVPPPAGLRAELRDYQRVGYSWLVFLARHGLGGILADDMGLGKTLQVLALLARLRESGEAGDEPRASLVIAPSSVVLGWKEQAARFTPDLRVHTHTGPDRWKRGVSLEDQDLVVTSYALLRRDVKKLASIDWRVVIFDEAQFLKNLASQSATAARLLRARARFALSGTPIENRLSELFALYDLVLPGFLGTESEFRERFERPIVQGGQSGGEADLHLRTRIRPYLVRRLKSDVLKELPERIEIELPLEMEPAQARLYAEILRGVRGDVFRHVRAHGIRRSAIHVLAALTRLRQVACDPRLLGPDLPRGIQGSAKITALREMLPELVEEGHAALVFSQFTGFLDLVEDLLRELDLPWLRLDGSTPTRQRAELVERFQKADGPPLFLISLRAGGTGLNLTRADYVFHLDPWWNPAVEDQATDRAHRIGQTRNVMAYKLITQGTVEARIRALQERKRDLAAAVLTEGGVASLTESELAELLEAPA